MVTPGLRGIASLAPAIACCVLKQPCTLLLLAVKLHLNEPLLGSPDVRHLVALCATADTLIERVTRLKNVESFDVQLLQEIEATCQELFPNKKPQARHPCLQKRHAGPAACVLAPCLLNMPRLCPHLYPASQETLQMLGLLDMFPYLTQGLVIGKLELVANNPGGAGGMG